MTRSADGSRRLAERLRAIGLEPVLCPLLRIEPEPGGPVDIAGYDWLVLTSRTAVELARRRLRPPWPRVAAVGPGTAAALREIGVKPAVVAAEPSQEGLLAVLPRPCGRVLFAGAAGARPLLAEALAADTIVLYRTIEDAPARIPDADLAVVASPSAARALASRRRDIACVSIGPTTTTAARAARLTVVAEAARSDLDGLVDAIRRAAGGGEGRT